MTDELKVIIGSILQVLGIAIGVLSIILLIKQHPIYLCLEIVGAGMYFFGKYLGKLIN